jgi:hypothetical protein
MTDMENPNPPTPGVPFDLEGSSVRYLDGIIGAAELTQLSAALLADRGNRAAFVRICVHRNQIREILDVAGNSIRDLPEAAEFEAALIALAMPASRQVAPSPMVIQPAGPPAKPQSRPRPASTPQGRIFYGIAAAILIFLVLAGMLVSRPRSTHVAANPPARIASVASTTDAKWEGITPSTNMPLPEAGLRLLSGFAILNLNNGSQIVVDGPTRFTLQPGGIALAEGSLSAHVSPSAKGFTVRTAGASIVDLGTEFGVWANAKGDTTIKVFKGRVSLQTLTPTNPPVTEIVTENSARQVIDGAISAIPFDAAAMVPPGQMDRWVAAGAGEFPAAFIKASGFELRDHAGAGAAVMLHGVNLGGWLCQEPWMCPTSTYFPPGSEAEREDQIERDLAKRFGVAKKNELIETYQNAWITETDLHSIAALGMTLIRVPITYCLFNEEDGTVRPDSAAFEHLDWVVREAGKRGIYTLIDLHRVQGGQTAPEPAGNPQSFFFNEKLKARTAQIWARIADHYRGNAMVVGYDLINEPWGVPIKLYDRFYKAIRQRDPDHVIFMETWGAENMPKLKSVGWSNVVYSHHFYPKGDEAKQIEEIDQLCDKFRAFRATAVAEGKVFPIDIGEFKFADSPKIYAEAIKDFADLHLSWTFWTYKTVNQGGWGLYNRLHDDPKPEVPNLYSDSADEIARKWAGWRTPAHSHLNPVTSAEMSVSQSAEAAK